MEYTNSFLSGHIVIDYDNTSIFVRIAFDDTTMENGTWYTYNFSPSTYRNLIINRIQWGIDEIGGIWIYEFENVLEIKNARFISSRNTRSISIYID